MKPSERIGSLLFNKDGEIVTVFEVSLKTINNHPIRDYKPIQITEDWLRKFGFEPRSAGSDRSIWYKGPVMITLEGDAFYLNGGSYPPKKYVHQLQNLFFDLTNKDL
jgi:hypothetical protein